MTLVERTGMRDLAYSRWHRPDSIRRFLSRKQAEALSSIDIDSVEVCKMCSGPLMLLEVARDVGQTFKPTTIIAELARRAGVPAALVFYLPDDRGDIESFRVRPLVPKRSRELVLDPREYAAWLQSLRDRHDCAAWVRTRGHESCRPGVAPQRVTRPVHAPSRAPEFRVPASVPASD